MAPQDGGGKSGGALGVMCVPVEEKHLASTLMQFNLRGAQCFYHNGKARCKLLPNTRGFDTKVFYHSVTDADMPKFV